MPNFEVDNAKEQIESLRNEISGERVMYEDIMKQLQDDKASFEEEQRANYMLLNRQYTDVLDKLHEKEKYSQQIVRDHIELKHIYELQERADQEQNEQINQENRTMRNAIRTICTDTRTTVDTAKSEYELNSEEFSRQFREQNSQHAQNTAYIRDQYKKMSTLYK